MSLLQPFIEGVWELMQKLSYFIPPSRSLMTLHWTFVINTSHELLLPHYFMFARDQLLRDREEELGHLSRAET